MNFTPQQKQQYKQRYLELLAKCDHIIEGSLDFANMWDQRGPLINEIMKHSEIARVVSSSEIFKMVYSSVLRLRYKHKDLTDFKLSEKTSAADFDRAAENFIRLLEGLPYEHFFYFRLALDLPESISSIRLTDDVELVKQADESGASLEYQSPLASVLAEQYSSPVKAKNVFLKVRAVGYGTAVQASATSILKQFLYLTATSGVLISETWKRLSGQLYEVNHFEAIKLPDVGIQQFNLSSEVAAYIAGLVLQQDKFAGFEPDKKRFKGLLGPELPPETYEEFFQSKFIAGCRSFIRLQDQSKKRDREHIMSAIEWGFDGMANPNETMGFIQTCIGLEALLGDRRGNEDESLTVRLADRSAYLLGKTPSQRKARTIEFKEIYTLRSKLVHGAWPSVRDQHYPTTAKAAALLVSLIWKELFLDWEFEPPF